jgi:hypothetical protein
MVPSLTDMGVTFLLEKSSSLERHCAFLFRYKVMRDGVLGFWGDRKSVV